MPFVIAVETERFAAYCAQGRKFVSISVPPLGRFLCHSFPHCQIGREFEGYLGGNAQTDLTTDPDHFVVRAKRRGVGQNRKKHYENRATFIMLLFRATRWGPLTCDRKFIFILEFGHPMCYSGVRYEGDRYPKSLSCFQVSKRACPRMKRIIPRQALFLYSYSFPRSSVGTSKSRTGFNRSFAQARFPTSR
jgi:hypothetical protein